MITFSGITEELIASGIGSIIHKSFSSIRHLNLKIYKPDSDVRIAFSNILRLSNGNQYLLVRNLHRKETFSPFGGVIKFKENAAVDLDSIDFRHQIIGSTEDMSNDLRGFLPRKNLTKMISWYNKRIDRESYSECLLRELKEEISEAKLPKHLVCPNKLSFRFVRRVIEKPQYIESIRCHQYRIFEVYDLYPMPEEYERFVLKLFKLEETNKNLLSVCHEEIQKGRAKGGEVIGPHTQYLVGRKRNRQDDPIFY